MAILDGNKAAHEALVDIAKYCAQSALNAPQITGRLGLKTAIVTGEDLLPLMEAYSILGAGDEFMLLDYRTYKAAYDAGEPPVVLLLGANTTKSEMAWDCGACGFKTCGEFNKYSKENFGRGAGFQGPSCNWKAFDFGIACDWACAAAHQHNIQNRIQFSAGAILSLLGYMDGCENVLALPLGPNKEFWYYSRETLAKTYTYESWMEQMLRMSPAAFTGFTGSGSPMVRTTSNWSENPRYIRVQSDPEMEENKLQIKTKLIEFIIKYNTEKAEKENRKD